MKHTKNFHRAIFNIQKEARLIWQTGGAESMGETEKPPTTLSTHDPELYDLSTIAGNIDPLRRKVESQMNEDYKETLDDVWKYHDKQLQYYTAKDSFLQRGYDPRTDVSLGPQISLNGHSMGTNSLGYMQAKLNKNARSRARGRMGIPDWQVQQYQQGIAQLANIKQQNMQQHMQASLNQFASKRAAAHGLPQPTAINAGINRTINARQEQKEIASVLAKMVEVVTKAIAAFLSVFHEKVADKDKVDEKHIDEWLESNETELQGMIDKWDGIDNMDDFKEMILTEDWSEAKLENVLTTWRSALEKLNEIDEKLKTLGKEIGEYRITIDGIRLKHPVHQLHHILGVAHQKMPVTISWEKAAKLLNSFAEGYTVSDAKKEEEKK